MKSSLLITGGPTGQAPTPATALPARPLVDTPDSIPFDQGRWDVWVSKGRRADAAFTEKVRTLALLGVVVAGIGAGAVWLVFA